MKINMKSKSVTLATKGCYCPEDVEIEAKMQEKTIAQNGEVVADSGFAGLSKVTVAVPEPDAKIVDVDELPTADIDDRVYYRMDGKLYRYVVPTADSIPVEGVWQFKSDIYGLPKFGSLFYILGSMYTSDHTVPMTGGSHRTTARVDTVYGGTLAFFFGDNIGAWSYPRFYYVLNSGWRYQESADGQYIASDAPKIEVTSIESGDIQVFEDWLRTYAYKQDAPTEGWQCYLVPDGSVTIAENGTVDVTDKAEVIVDVPKTTLTDLSITKNGTYTPNDGQGYGTVSVNVEAQGGGIVLPTVKPRITLATNITVGSITAKMAIAFDDISDLTVTKGE